MPDTNISSTVASDLTNAMTDYSVNQEITDAAGDQNETEWTNSEWTQWFGYYRNIPELQAAIDAKATWTVGKGFIADEATTMLLDGITGWGKDTFNTILENAVRTYQIGGDFFAEIILDEKDNLVNLKPLDPSSVKIIANGKGRIKRYEQITKIGEKKEVKKFEPHRIFHLARNRVADEIHGQSLVRALETLILMRNEAMSDYKKVLHRNVAPLFVFHLDTDDTNKIASFRTTYDNARKDGENLYVPKGVVEPELVGLSPNATMNPIAWIEMLNRSFFQACGVPQIIVGGSGEFTEATAKTLYLAFQQNVEEEQLFIEEQVLAQLNLVIELEFPASLANEALSDKPKGSSSQESVNAPEIQRNEKAIEPNDQVVEMEGRK